MRLCLCWRLRFLCGFCALFMGPASMGFSKFFFKTGSHGTIHTFKNYFAIVFSIFSFQQLVVSKQTLIVPHENLQLFAPFAKSLVAHGWHLLVCPWHPEFKSPLPVVTIKFETEKSSTSKSEPITTKETQYLKFIKKIWTKGKDAQKFPVQTFSLVSNSFKLQF